MRNVPAEETQQSDEDEVKGDDVIQQARHDEDENAGDRRGVLANTF